MAIPVKMPQKGLSEESCIITKWNRKKGEAVKTGDILFTIETGKSTFDVEAEADGIILDVFFDEGDEVPISAFVCVIGNAGENSDEYNPNKKNSVNVEKPVEKENLADTARSNSVPESPSIMEYKSDELKISPRARNLAAKSGVDYRYAAPTGPKGRIIERDVLSLIDKGPLLTPSAKDEYFNRDIKEQVAGTGLGGRITTSDLQQRTVPEIEPVPAAKPALYTEEKLSNIRKVIAKNMHNSLASTAQLTLNSSFDASDILSYRKKIKETREQLGLNDISINDIILYAVSRTLLNHKALNAHLADEKMLVFTNVHLGVATDTERGLVVPTLFDANLKSLNEISAETKKMIEACRKGSIDPKALQGASFTVTNLGALDIESFTPVLNPPQTGILGVNNIIQRVKCVNGEYSYYPAMGLSLTFDHRAIDGAPAARFLKELKNNLENFSVLLAK